MAELDAGFTSAPWEPRGPRAGVLAEMRPAFVVGFLTPVGVAAAVVWLDLILGWLGLPGYLR
jgi:hypothetical protein